VQFDHRQLRPNELDHELVWLTVSLSSLALAAAWLGFGLPWPQCVFHELTGLPCLTCGMTRSAIAFFHGHLIEAWSWNPLIFVSLCGLSIFDVYAFAVLVTAAPRLRVNFSSTVKNYARTAVIAVVALNWIYLLLQWRNFS
jgi:hypothetical protein